MENLVIWAPIMGVVALAYAFTLVLRINNSPAGNYRMQEISEAIHEGAMAFLFREYRILSIFVILMFAIIGVLLVGNCNSYIWKCCIVLSGYIGMYVATKANVRQRMQLESQDKVNCVFWWSC